MLQVLAERRATFLEETQDGLHKQTAKLVSQVAAISEELASGLQQRKLVEDELHEVRARLDDEQRLVWPTTSCAPNYNSPIEQHSILLLHQATSRQFIRTSKLRASLPSHFCGPDKPVRRRSSGASATSVAGQSHYLYWQQICKTSCFFRGG